MSLCAVQVLCKRKESRGNRDECGVGGIELNNIILKYPKLVLDTGPGRGIRWDETPIAY